MSKIVFNLQNHPTFHLEGRMGKRERVLCWSIFIISLCTEFQTKPGKAPLGTGLDAEKMSG